MSGPEMFFDKRFIWYHDLVTAWRKIYKRQFLIDNHIEFGEHIMFEDNDYAIQVFAKAKRVCHIQLNCYNYRNNPESITRVRVTSNHIDYWLKVCHRLSVFRQQFLIEGIDLRFQKLIDSFIRYELRHVVEMYHQLAKDEREVAKQIIRKGCDKSMRQYMPVKMYYKVRFGLL